MSVDTKPKADESEPEHHPDQSGHTAGSEDGTTESEAEADEWRDRDDSDLTHTPESLCWEWNERADRGDSRAEITATTTFSRSTVADHVRGVCGHGEQPRCPYCREPVGSIRGHVGGCDVARSVSRVLTEPDQSGNDEGGD